MNAIGREAQNNIAGLHLAGIQNFGFFNNAYRKTSQVIFTVGIHAGHFSGFATNERATRLFTTIGNTAHYTCGCFNVQFAACKVIEKIKGLCALNQNIVGTHGHQINTHGVVNVPLKGQTQLGTHTIGAGDEHGFFVPFGYFEHGAKTANTSQHTWAHGALCHGFDCINQIITGLHVNAGVFVGQGRIH